MLTEQMFNVKQLCFQARTEQTIQRLCTRVVNFSKLVLKINLQEFACNGYLITILHSSFAGRLSTDKIASKVKSRSVDIKLNQRHLSN